MADEARVAYFEELITNYLQDNALGLSRMTADHGWGGYGMLVRMIPELGEDRPAFVAAMENLLRQTDVPIAVKVGIVDLAALQVGEIVDAVRELHESVSEDISQYVPGSLPSSMTVRLRLLINKFLAYQRI
jgi:hypothetical protein